MRNTVVVVSLGKILKNAELVASYAGVPLIAVVKDDAYGHGAEAVANALENAVSAFAVANCGEGASLRIAGISKPILVLSPAVEEEEILRAAHYGLTVSVSSFPALRLLCAAAEKYGLFLNAHIAVNTGMNRYGFPAGEMEKVCLVCEKLRGCLCVTGVYSHFYLPGDEAAREGQYRLFCTAAETVRKVYPDAVRHLSATGGALAGEKYRFDAVRAGLALYGYLPDSFCGAIAAEPAMRVYAAVAQSGLFTGGGIGYQKAEREYSGLYTLRFGYGDGFFREGEGAGKLCMDACVCEGNVPFGAWKLILSDAQVYAEKHGTSVYEALVRVGEGAVKYYV